MPEMHLACWIMLRCSLFFTGFVVRVVEVFCPVVSQISARLFMLDDGWGKYAHILYYHQGV